MKFNCADDAYVFPLEICDLVSRNSRIGWNEPGERLVWVFSSEIDKGGPGSRYAIFKVTNGSMTANKGVWSWTAKEGPVKVGWF